LLTVVLGLKNKIKNQISIHFHSPLGSYFSFRKTDISFSYEI